MHTRKKTESERFKGPAKYAEYLVARSLVTVLQRLPIGFAYRLGWGVGWLAWKCLKQRRATVRKNLEIVNKWGRQQAAGSEEQAAGSRGQGSESREAGAPQVLGLKSHPSLELAQQVRAVFLRAGANLFAGFTFNRMSPVQAARHIEIEGIEHLKAALAEGKGVIVLLAHMGPWEALTQLPQFAQSHGIHAPFGAMYRPLNNTYLDDWFKAQRESQGTRLFSRRDGFHKPVDFLRSGGMLGILSDQKLREGPRVPYFGVDVPSTPIPGLFHRRSGAPFCALSVQNIKQTRWRFSLRCVSVAPETDLSSREALAALCNQAIADALAESPLDGFWLHDRF